MRVIWITGASSGIGEALAKAFIADGAHVILSARREDRLTALQQALGDHSTVIPLDVADPASIRTASEAALAWKGHIDVLINNAGISQRATVMDSEMDAVRRVMEVNFFGLVDLTKQVLPSMLARGKGQVVNISSVAGYIATPLRSTYSASKFAVRAWSDSLRAELASDGITVTVILPGYVQTEISRSALTGDGSQKGTDDKAIQNGMDVDDAARRMVKAIHAGKREFLVGGKETWAVYLKRFAPGLVARMLPRAAPE